ncbi:MAG: replicative DNA helicase [Clostridia bacterium]|nr:replicative DNA helicase [Clostridia bacterium]
MEARPELRGVTPPNSLEAERSVLGAMLQDENAVEQACKRLQAEDFYQPQHREIYDAMRKLHMEQSPVDMVTVDSELSRRGTLEGVGGTAYIIELSQYVPTTANVRAYIALVAEKATLRKLIQASQEITQECYSQVNPLQDTLNHAEKAIFDIVMNRASGDTLVHVKEVLYNTYANIEELAKLKGRVSGVPTGFTALDNMLTGLHGGELIILGARPSMGKTSLAMNIAGHACLNAGKSVAVFSLEMPREQIALRLLCSDARVDMQKVRQGRLDSDDWMRLAKSIGPMANSRLYIDDTAGITPTQLRSRCRRLMMDKGLDLIVLDYLGLMHADGKVENRQLEVSEISRSLTAIALELKVPLLACAQLSRASTTRDNKRPALSDLRDSGSIEQDADVVMFIHREGYYDPECEEKNVGEIIVQKQRNGPLGTVKVAWLSEYTTYANLAPEAGGYGDAPF